MPNPPTSTSPDSCESEGKLKAPSPPKEAISKWGNAESFHLASACVGQQSSFRFEKMMLGIFPNGMTKVRLCNPLSWLVFIVTGKEVGFDSLLFLCKDRGF